MPAFILYCFLIDPFIHQFIHWLLTFLCIYLFIYLMFVLYLQNSFCNPLQLLQIECSDGASIILNRSKFQKRLCFWLVFMYRLIFVLWFVLAPFFMFVSVFRIFIKHGPFFIMSIHFSLRYTMDVIVLLTIYVFQKNSEYSIGGFRVYI